METMTHGRTPEEMREAKTWEKRATRTRVYADMTAEQLRAALKEVGLLAWESGDYGWGWFADLMGVKPATVERWVRGEAKIPQHVISYVLLARELKGLPTYL